MVVDRAQEEVGRGGLKKAIHFLDNYCWQKTTIYCLDCFQEKKNQTRSPYSKYFAGLSTLNKTALYSHTGLTASTRIKIITFNNSKPLKCTVSSIFLPSASISIHYRAWFFYNVCKMWGVMNLTLLCLPMTWW